MTVFRIQKFLLLLPPGNMDKILFSLHLYKNHFY